MQSKNTITIVHVMAGMCGMYKLCYLDTGGIMPTVTD